MDMSRCLANSLQRTGSGRHAKAATPPAWVGAAAGSLLQGWQQAAKAAKAERSKYLDLAERRWLELASPCYYYYYFTRAVYRPKEGTAILLGGGLPCGPHILRCSKTGRSCCSQDASVVASEPSGALLLHSPYLVLVGAVVFVVFFLLGSLGRGAPARPPAAEADNTIASIS